MYTLSSDKSTLYFGDRLLGPAPSIFVTSHQDLYHHEGTVAVNLTVGDEVMVTSEGTVIVVEEKRVGDLESSWRSRRLQRQLRKMLQANPSGINILALRASQGEAITEVLWLDVPPELCLDLLKWQALGGLVAFAPRQPTKMLETLKEWRAVLKPGHPLLSVVSGDDRNTVRQGDLTPCAWALRKAIKGVGPKMAAAWAEASRQDIVQALDMLEEGLREVGLNKTVIRLVKELRRE